MYVYYEPTKDDIAAFVFMYEDVAEHINNDTIMDLNVIEHDRIIHIGKGLELIKDGFTYLNPDDMI